MKIGDKIKYRCAYIHYKYLGDKHPEQGVRVIDAAIVGKAKGTEFSGSDWVVKHDNGHIVGIGKEQILNS